MKKTFLLALCVSAAALAQDGPLTTEAKATYESIKNNLVRSAEKVSEADYSFQPTPEVRTFARLVGHVADAQFNMCGSVLGEKPPMSGVEKSKTTKSDLVEALKASVAFCDKAYASVSDANAADMVKMFGRDRSKLGVLYFNISHDNEHYGNMVTYMRIKGIVPPSSERR